MLDDGHKALRLLIYGRIKGGVFRDWIVKTALKLGLNGWVRNRTDGPVEGMIVGDNDIVDKMVQQCWVGPNTAKVDNIELTNAIGIVKNGFEQKPTVNLNERRGS